MTKNTTLALFSAVSFLALLGCGSNEPDVSQSCKQGSDPNVALNCTSEPGTGSITTEPQSTGGTTGTATSTDTGTGTGSTTGTTTSTTTQPVTVTTTTTATSTVITSTPSCNSGTDPRDSATGGKESMGDGTWHIVDANGQEWIQNVVVDVYGMASACGMLLSEVNSYTPPSLTRWTGVSTVHCLYWAPNKSTAPTIYGTGISQDPTDSSRLVITGGSITAWSSGRQVIKACPW